MLLIMDKGIGGCNDYKTVIVFLKVIFHLRLAELKTTKTLSEQSALVQRFGKHKPEV